MEGLQLRPMSEAPKDGSEILIMWREDGKYHDYRGQAASLAKWSNAHYWQYVCPRKNMVFNIYSPLGWLPVPKSSETA